MDRRRLLAALGTGSLWPLAGCAFASGTDDSATPTAGETAIPATERTTVGVARHGLPSDICEEERSEDPGIYAITDPAFADDWSGVGPESVYVENGASGLVDEQTVIGLATDGEARAYPVSVLWYHEIVNDVVGSQSSGFGPVMVTYCPLCKSGVVASRVIDSEATRFLVTGLLWKAPQLQEAESEADGRVFGADRTGGDDADVRHSGNLVMYDEATESYWSQILAKAICGPKTGDILDVVPSTVTTWTAWQDDHPDTTVLLPPPRSETVTPEE